MYLTSDDEKEGIFTIEITNGNRLAIKGNLSFMTIKGENEKTKDTIC